MSTTRVWVPNPKNENGGYWHVKKVTKKKGFFGKIASGIKKVGKFAWKHKGKIALGAAGLGLAGIGPLAGVAAKAKGVLGLTKASGAIGGTGAVGKVATGVGAGAGLKKIWDGANKILGSPVGSTALGFLADRSAQKQAASSEDKHYNYLDKSGEQMRAHQRGLQEAGFDFQREQTAEGRKYSEGRYDIERQDAMDDSKELRTYGTNEDLRYNLASMKDKVEYGKSLGMSPWDVIGQGGATAGGGGGMPGPVTGAATSARGQMAASQAAAEQMAGAGHVQAAIGAEGTIAAARAGAAGTKHAADMNYNANQLGTRLSSIVNILSQKNQMAMTKFQGYMNLAGIVGKNNPKMAWNMLEDIRRGKGVFAKMSGDYEQGLVEQQLRKLQAETTLVHSQKGLTDKYADTEWQRKELIYQQRQREVWLLKNAPWIYGSGAFRDVGIGIGGGAGVIPGGKYPQKNPIGFRK